MGKMRLSWIFALLVILSLVLAACPAQQPAPAAPAQEQAAAPAEAESASGATEAATEEAPAASPEDYINASREETVIFDIDGGRVTDPELWNPFVPGNRRDHGYHQAILEPLFILNYQTGEFIPWLGESFEANETNDVWVLKLREGVEWSDGTPFTADDVVFTIQMLIDNAPELGDSAAMKDWVASIEKVDDLTVQFNLTRPNPRFQLDYFSVKIWGSVNIMPKHIWEGQDPLTFKFYDPEKGWPVGTGPYTLASVSQTEFVYVRNDNWWGAKTGWKPLPAPKKLVWTWAGPEETRAALMADRQLDSLMDITLGALQALQARNPNVITWFREMPKAWVPDPCSRTFELNHAVEPWNDPDMRWALNYAIDRDQIVQIAYEGTTLKSRHFFPAYPPLDALVDKAIEAGVYDLDQLWTHDPDRAREIIESKGYTLNSNGYYEKDGQELRLDITTHEAFIEKQRIAQVIVEQLQAVGINATTRNEAGGTWGENFAFGRFEARVGWQTCGSVNEPWASLDTFNVRWLKPVGERADNDEWRWQGEQATLYSNLVDEMGTLPLGDPKVEELFIQAMDIWFDELPVIPITQAKKIIPFDTTYWTGWPTADNDYIHPPTWWQHTHVIIHNLQPAGQ
ncbi:ABC transporter substrate-binding protein [Litorilinea aerophila]|uniref:ABC transporter substrate-binding protein n=1 Tax=Litorilinea aerophila TaxID=1204385 RepID=A0A540VM98_9CHLR|nr:ABC transporter substrate-binding protein [Litorilinea aerophila]MCC9074592.1 ABC transporter substrate-binding protein [Litorilinea aerophila]